MTELLIQGIHGRMGRALCALAEGRSDCHIAAGVDPADAAAGAAPVFPSLDACTVQADVLIDFSCPAATQAAIAYCGAHGLPLVACTTGLTGEQERGLQTLSQTVPVFRSANMSLGINLLMELVRQANAVLGTDFDIEIVEKHHHNKLDAPSGTALMIADALRQSANVPYHLVYDRHERRAKRDPSEIGMHAVRGGSIVGEHEVLFAGPQEELLITHRAESREVFAAGALAAAVFLARQPAGMYTMKDLICRDREKK